jgi:hypothetical protein
MRLKKSTAPEELVAPRLRNASIITYLERRSTGSRGRLGGPASPSREAGEARRTTPPGRHRRGEGAQAEGWRRGQLGRPTALPLRRPPPPQRARRRPSQRPRRGGRRRTRRRERPAAARHPERGGDRSGGGAIQSAAPRRRTSSTRQFLGSRDEQRRTAKAATMGIIALARVSFRGEEADGGRGASHVTAAKNLPQNCEPSF